MSMISILKRGVLLLAVLLLAACGGGGSSGTAILSGGGGTGTTTTTPAASSLVLTLSSSTIANNGSQSVTATALALDANNNTIVGVPVVISVDSGVVTPSGKVTGSGGAVTGAVGIGSDASSRTITVTATSGAIVRTAQLSVVSSTSSSGSSPSDLLLSLSAPTIAIDGSQTVTATVTALDAKRNVLPGVNVAFAVDQAATIQAAGTTTLADGVQTATIRVAGATLNQTITVTATTNGLPARTASLKVASAPVSATPTAADLTLVLSSSRIDNGGGSTVVATVTAVDSNRNALAGIPVSFSVDSNAVLVPGGQQTNANGVVTATIGVGADRTNRVVNVVATSGAITRALPLTVYGAKLTASLSPVVNVGSTASNVVRYKLADFADLPMVGQSISITANGLPTTTGVTDSSGLFDYSYLAPTVAGQLSIVATAAGFPLTSVVAVTAAGGVPNAAVVPQSASLTPSPSVISVNSVGSSVNQVQLRALFVGPNNLPVPNIRVRFDLDGNSNSSDGVVAYVGSYAYSDASGVARGTFTPGQIASPTNGITVRACWDLVDFAANTCPNAVKSTLTVASEALSVAIGTNNLVSAGAANLTYIKKFVVMVVDAAGTAKPGVLITPSVDLPSYYKGYYTWDAGRKIWVQTMTLLNILNANGVPIGGTESFVYDSAASAWKQNGPTAQPSCLNEDVNRNGVREALAYSPTGLTPALAARGEDLNWNGSLDPRKADVAVTMVGSATTDSSGLAVVQIEYPKSLATWVDYVITVTASGISGTEARDQYSGLFYGLGNLPGLAADVSDEKVPPPFVISPYGKSSTCTDAK